ncbi:MAG: IclR family transcriptional regulator, partial [Thermotoga sp.]
MVETVKKTLEIMSYIVNSSKSVKVSDVARTFNMSVSNASRYLKIFEQYGIVIRKRDGSYIPG